MEDMEPRAALSAISRQKGEGMVAGEYAESADTQRERTVAAVWLAYERLLAKEGAVDFDDLLLQAVRFLKNNPEKRAAYQARWPYITYRRVPGH